MKEVYKKIKFYTPTIVDCF